MNQDEIKTEIEKLDSFRSDCEGKMVTLSAALDEFIIMVATLKAQLAEAETPELGHGDYGIDDDNRSFVVVEQASLFGSPKAFFESQMGQIRADEAMSPDFRIGNIYKYLKALAEPLKEFEYGDITGRISVDEKRPDGVCIGGFWHTIKTAKILSMKIQRLIFTAEQESAK